jgi:hypothetical protein
MWGNVWQSESDLASKVGLCPNKQAKEAKKTKQTK